MRVLVTRPRPAAERTAARLSAMGHEAVILPLMQAQHLAGAARAALSEPHQAIAVSSGEAVRVLGALGPALEPHLATPLFAVGEATARAAGDLGFTDVRIGPGTGEGLAETVAALLPPAKRWSISPVHREPTVSNGHCTNGGSSTGPPNATGWRRSTILRRRCPDSSARAPSMRSCSIPARARGAWTQHCGRAGLNPRTSPRAFSA